MSARDRFPELARFAAATGGDDAVAQRRRQVAQILDSLDAAEGAPCEHGQWLQSSRPEWAAVGVAWLLRCPRCGLEDVILSEAGPVR